MEHSLDTCTRCERRPAVIEHPDGPWCGACALAAFAERSDHDETVLHRHPDRVEELGTRPAAEDPPADKRLSR